MSNKVEAVKGSDAKMVYSEDHVKGEGFVVGVSGDGQIDMLLLEEWPEENAVYKVLATLSMSPEAASLLVESLQRALPEAKIRQGTGPEDPEQWQ